MLTSSAEFTRTPSPLLHGDLYGCSVSISLVKFSQAIFPPRRLAAATAKIHFPEAEGACPTVPVTLSCAAQNSQVAQLWPLRVPATCLSPASPSLLLPIMSREAELCHLCGRAETSQMFGFQLGQTGTISWGPEGCPCTLPLPVGQHPLRALSMLTCPSLMHRFPYLLAPPPGPFPVPPSPLPTSPSSLLFA